MRNRQLLVWSVFVSMLSVRITSGGTESDDGKYKEFWESHAVVVGKIEKFTPSAERMDVKVVAVIATDIVVPMSLTVDGMRLQERVSDVNHSEGKTYVLCIERSAHGWTLPQNGLAFLPYYGMLELKDLDDPLLARVVASVQKVRREIKK